MSVPIIWLHNTEKLECLLLQFLQNSFLLVGREQARHFDKESNKKQKLIIWIFDAPVFMAPSVKRALLWLFLPE